MAIQKSVDIIQKSSFFCHLQFFLKNQKTFLDIIRVSNSFIQHEIRPDLGLNILPRLSAGHKEIVNDKKYL